MNCRGFVLDVSMVVVCYLVISIPMVFATNVNVIVGGGSIDSVQYNPGDFVRINGFVYDDGMPKIGRDQDWRVDFVVENNTNDVVIESGYVYQCGGLDPGSCVDYISPDAFSGSFEKTYNWIDIRGEDSPVHEEVSNFVVFARVVKSGKAFWTGFHYQVRRTAYNVFYGVSDDISDIDVHVSDYAYVYKVMDFIQDSFMIPFNPEWVERVVFQGIDFIFEMRSNTPPYLETDVEESDEVSDLSYNYDFVFSNSSSGIYNAIVLNLNPSYVCGNDVCESGLGENSNNCCLDCGCISGYYCDAIEGCRNENLITLSLSGTQTTYVSNCYEAHQIYANVKVNNAPSDMIVLNSYYSLGGGSPQAAVCSPLYGGAYSCQINIPPVPGCGEGTPDIGPNSITFDIGYSADGVLKYKTISTSYPDITITSFTCGDGSCEEDLGEDSANCCYDCGCGTGYCDIEDLYSPGSGSCRPGLGDSNLNVNLDKTIFSSYNSGGESVGLDMEINNAPSSLNVYGETCEMNCEKDYGYPCSASCGVGCSLGSSENNVYGTRCSMVFTITDYDNNVDYILTPVISVSAGYYSGPDQVVDVLSTTPGAVTIGANLCGDGICLGGDIENAGNCCYDCECPGERYCYTENRNAPSEGDSCRYLDGIGFVVDDIGPFTFSDSAVENIINMHVSIDTEPAGLVITPSCQIGEGEVRCRIDCVGDAASESGMMCALKILPVNYKDPDLSDWYASLDHKLKLPGNHVNFTFMFNDGYRVMERVFTEPLQDIVMDVIWHCGDGSYVCETDLWESSANCCVDCGCSGDEFCHIVNDLNGECIDRSEIQLGSVGIVPDLMECSIGLMNPSLCIFPNPRADAIIEIKNLPAGVETIGSSYSINGIECKTGSTECEMSCTPGVEPDVMECAFLVPHISSGDEGNLSFDVDFSLTLQHPADFSTGAVFTEDFEMSGSFDVSMVQTEELKSCTFMEMYMEEKGEKLGEMESKVKIITNVFRGITAALAVACALGCGIICCIAAIIGGIITAILQATLNPMVDKMEKSVDELRSKYASMCAAAAISDMASVINDVGLLSDEMVGDIQGAQGTLTQLNESLSAESGTINVVGGTTDADAYMESQPPSLPE
jgi:hypothetical protein